MEENKNVETKTVSVEAKPESKARRFLKGVGLVALGGALTIGAAMFLGGKDDSDDSTAEE